jgi:hypothetical protein
MQGLANRSAIAGSRGMVRNHQHPTRFENRVKLAVPDPAQPHLPTEIWSRATTLLDSEALFAEHAFENNLPIPEVIDATNGRHITLQIRQISQFLGLYDSDGHPLDTNTFYQLIPRCISPTR